MTASDRIYSNSEKEIGCGRGAANDFADMQMEI